MKKILSILITLFLFGCATVEKKSESIEHKNSMDSGSYTITSSIEPKNSMDSGLYTITSFEGNYYEVEDLEIKPQPIKQVAPIYPKEFKRTKTNGVAHCCFIVDSNGNATQIQVERATSIHFAESAIKALEKWKFSPGAKDGEKVNTLVKVPLYFKIN